MINYKIYQQTSGLCGPASLKTVFDYLGLVKTEEEWKNLSGATEKDGVGMEGLVQAVESVGYRGTRLSNVTKEELQKLMSNQKLVIVNWWSTDCGHYSPVVDVTEKEIILADVELENYRKMDWETFELNWFDFNNYPPKTTSDLLLREALTISPKD